MPPPPDYDRTQANFQSTDSFAGGLARPVSMLRAPALLLTFTTIALFQLWLFELGFLDRFFRTHDYVFGPYLGFSAISIRRHISASLSSCLSCAPRSRCAANAIARGPRSSNSRFA